VPPAVHSQRPLALSVTSVTPVTNDKGDNEMIPGAVYRSPGICFKAEENVRKTQLGNRLMKWLCDLGINLRMMMTYNVFKRYQ
jgi:hypothetical protein